MYQLSNQELTVHILDPEGDSARFGPRYCTGGYIFQVEDSRFGPILSGPTYPESFNWFDGQGIPDSFFQAPLREPGSRSADSLVLGIGRCDMGRREVLEYTRWSVRPAESRIEMTTSQELGPYRMELTRTVELAHRTIRSTTVIRNQGKPQFPVVWFPHPFFPHSGAGPLCRLPGPVEFDADRAYSVDEAGFFHCGNWSAGGALPVTSGSSGALTVLYRHPQAGLIAADFSYAPGHILLWGNKNTFSFEPYFERTVGVESSVTFWVAYHL